MDLHFNHILFFQIPHYEWNSMELSSMEAKIEYLEKKIFEKLWYPSVEKKNKKILYGL